MGRGRPAGDEFAAGESERRTKAAERAALRLLSAREHGRAELRRKLIAKGHAEAVIDPVLAALAQGGLLSEQRFIESYVAQRCRKGYGPERIRAELSERGVPAAEVETELQNCADQWWPRMVELVERQFGTEPPGDRREQARWARFLERRGYPAEMIRHLLWE